MALSITGNTSAERKACLLENGIMSDCNFVVCEGKTSIPAHKVILAMASPVIEKMFCKNFKEHNGIISIPDEDKLQDPGLTVRLLLKYVYLGESKLNSFQEAMDVYKLANYFEIIEAEKLCEKFLYDHIYATNACRIYEFSKLYNVKSLQPKCFQFFSDHTKEVINGDFFSEIQLYTLLEVLSLDNLNIDSEIQLIEPIYKWGIAECKRRGIQNLSQESIFSVCELAIKKIRFLMMTPDEFASNLIINTKLLHKDDCLAILSNLCTSDPAFSLPEGMSKTRVKRIKFCIPEGPDNKTPDMRVFTSPTTAFQGAFCNPVTPSAFSTSTFKHL